VAEKAAAVPEAGGLQAFKHHPELGRLLPQDWQRFQRSDPQLARIIECVRAGRVPGDAGGEQIKRWAAECSLLELDGGAEVLVRSSITPAAVQVAVPKVLRDQVLDALHGSAWGGHQGVVRTKERARLCVWWPSWSADTQYWVSHCWACQAYKRSGKLSKWPLVWRERPPHPFHTIALDFFGPLTTSAAGHKWILVAMDMYSGFVELYAVKPEDMNSAGVAECLVDQLCTRHGAPVRILSDRGSVFLSELAQKVYAQLGARKLNTTAYHPQTNGKVERFMQQLAQMLAMATDCAKADWHVWLPHVAFAQNTSHNRNTGSTPYLLAMGRQPHIALHVLMGKLLELSGDEQWAPSTLHLVEQLVSRQREAAGVAEHRHELRRRKVLRETTCSKEHLGCAIPQPQGTACGITTTSARMWHTSLHMARRRAMGRRLGCCRVICCQ
jgi:transposase InsO family protein